MMPGYGVTPLQEILRGRRTNGRRLLNLTVLIFAAAVLTTLPARGGDHLVPRHDDIPQVMWCQGCAPTSASMVLGYWDSDVNGYGRLVDFWKYAPEYLNSAIPTRNVPNVLEELRSAMGTDNQGGTDISNIAPGIHHVANTVNGYSFEVDTQDGTVSDPGYWPAIMNRIDIGTPFVWGVVGSQSGHALCAWGYRDDRYVITYNTWWYGRDDWHYAEYHSPAVEPATHASITTVIPGSPSVDTVFLHQPSGGEILTPGLVYPIVWFHGNMGINRVDLSYSIDNGISWTPIATNLADDYWMSHSYDWLVPNQPTGALRVRIRGYQNGTYLAGDGSSAPCRIEDETVAYLPSPEIIVSESAGSAQVNISLTRPPGAGNTLSVDWLLEDMTATAGEDYVGSAGTLIFGPAETTKSFQVTILEDAVWEDYEERAVIRLVNPNGCKLYPGISEAELVIRDNDMQRDEAGGWQNTFGGGNVDEGRALAATDDGGYILAGMTASFGGAMQSCYIVKVDRHGNQQWQQTFAENSLNEACDIQQTADGGFVLLGRTYWSTSVGGIYRGFANALLIKLDRWGTETWRKTFSAGYDSNLAQSVQPQTEVMLLEVLRGLQIRITLRILTYS